MARAELPRHGRAYIQAVSIAGVALAGACAYTIMVGSVPAAWLIFAGLTVATATFSLKIPSIDSTLTVSEIFAFTSILLFGPATGALAMAGLGAAVSLRWRFDLRKTLFNFGNLGISGWFGGVAFYALYRGVPVYSEPGHYPSMLLPVLGMTIAYFLSNSMLTAGAVAAASKQPFTRVWRTHFLPLAPSYIAYGSLALLLIMVMREGRLTAIAVLLPLLVISYLTVHASFGRLEDSKTHVTALNQLLLSAVETLATAIDAKDEVTHDHVRRVQQGTLALAREIGVTDELTLKAIEAAALLHDTGKIAIPEHILNKPGKLTAAEFEKMKRHAPIGADILSSIAFPYPVVPIVRHHHENWDGTGYPDRLAGADIPLGARILSVVDCFDALTSDRPYRGRMTDAQAIAILRERRGTMYDPVIVDAFIAAVPRIMPASNAAPHPAVKAIEDARARDREEEALQPAAAIRSMPPANDGLLAVTSLSRAMSGQARVGDVGALLWMILRQTLPCDAISIAMLDESLDAVAVRYAAGQHAAAFKGLSIELGNGVSGWVAATHRPAINADPGLDLGAQARTLTPALRSCLVIPVFDADDLIAVLSIYSEQAQAYSDDHVRLLELVTPKLAAALLDATIETEDEAAASAPPAVPQLRLVKSC